MQDIDKESLQSLGNCIRNLRNKRKWNISTLSKKVGVVPSTIKRIEEAESEIKYLTLKNIAYAFNISMEEFFRLVENQK